MEHRVATEPPQDVGGAVEPKVMADVVPAGLAPRLLAWLLDSLIVFLPLNPDLYLSGLSQALAFALGAPIALAYFIVFEGGPRGATLGKRAVGIRVVDGSTGASIGFRRAAMRRIAFVIGGLALYVGWLWLLFNQRRQAWHDRIADTIVIPAR
ncbi:MAG: RDD family protein [Actinobacteria bacterium]|nr:MAG: RDD family protein [Actinomycetota bacterium]